MKVINASRWLSNPLLLRWNKKKNIPRLELLGCLALTRIYNRRQEALSFVNFQDFDKTFWTDSRTVVSWIKIPPREVRLFVSVRVAKSRKQWDHSDSATSNRSVIHQALSSENTPWKKLRLHQNKMTRGKKTPEMFMPYPSQKEGRATPSFPNYWKDLQRSKRYAESCLIYIVLLNVQDTGMWPTVSWLSRNSCKQNYSSKNGARST